LLGKRTYYLSKFTALTVHFYCCETES
jgi:hypothetical protein